MASPFQAGRIGAGSPGTNNSPKQNGSGGAVNGPQGSTGNGMPVKPKPLPTTKTISLIPDTPDAATAPEPVDLSLLATEAEQPRRRALSSIVAPAQADITGYAGVFVP